MQGIKKTMVSIMIAYLTSHIGGYYKKDGKRIPVHLSSDNGFLDSLHKHWKADSNVLIISADADAAEINDSILCTFTSSFPMSELSINRIDICDKRNEHIVNKLDDFDVIILAGGHVLTQNRFFEKIQLKDHIKDFHGILIGISAGTMNSAEIVYAQPELEGEAIDQRYHKFLHGLAITKLMILSHYQDLKNEVLDGKRLFEDITYPDSYGREFYALVDGSYVLIENGSTTLFGEAHFIKDGNIKQICEKDESICIE